MNIEVGKEYRTRSGLRATVGSVNTDAAPYQFACWRQHGDGSVCLMSVTKEGQFLKGPTANHPFDLVAEWKEELVIEVGGVYKLRNGKKCVVLHELPECFKYKWAGVVDGDHSSISRWYANCSFHGRSDSEYDIVERIQ